MTSTEQTLLRARLRGLAKRCAAVHWVRGAASGAGVAIALAACVEVVSAFGLVGIPWLPWNLLFFVVPGCIVGALWGLRRSPRAEHSLHQLDRANGFPDVLLSGYELLTPAAQQSPATASLESYLLAGVQSALEKVRAETLTPWGWRRMTLWLTLPIILLGAAGTLTTVSPVGKACGAVGKWVPDVAVKVGPRASLSSDEDQETVAALLEDIRQTLEHSEDGDESVEALASLRETAKALLAREIPPAEALGTLERLKSLLSAQKSRKDGPSPAKEDPVLKRVLAQAKAELSGNSGKEDKEQSPSKLIETLAEWALDLAEKDPEAFEGLVKRLAKAMDGRTLSRLKDKHSALSKKLEAMARKIGADPKKARRLKKLRSQLDSLSGDIAEKEKEARRPQLERLRKALTPPAKNNSQKAAEPPNSQNKSGKKGEAAANSDKRRGASAKKSAQGKSPAKTQRKSKQVGSALKKLSSDMAKKKNLQRVRKRLDKTTSKLRREVAERRAEERMRQFAKKKKNNAGPRRLSKKGGGGRKLAAKTGKTGGTGEKAGGGLKPGSSHEKQERTRKSTKDSEHEFQDSVVSNDGKPGSYRRRKYKSSSTLGKDATRPAKATFDPDLDDEVLKSRIPNRYRETVRTYFKLLPELFDD